MRPEIDVVKEAKAEAERFIARANIFLLQVGQSPYEGWQMKSRSAMRRASMDLTRALAEVRRRQ